MILGPHRNSRELADPPRQYHGFGPGAGIFWHKRSVSFPAASKAAQRRDFARDQLLSSQPSYEQQTQRNQRSNGDRRDGFDIHVSPLRLSPHGAGCSVNVSRAVLLQYSFSRLAAARPGQVPGGRGLQGSHRRTHSKARPGLLPRRGFQRKRRPAISIRMPS
jgi:hypothetical protein